MLQIFICGHGSSESTRIFSSCDDADAFVDKYSYASDGRAAAAEFDSDACACGGTRIGGGGFRCCSGALAVGSSVSMEHCFPLLVVLLSSTLQGCFLLAVPLLLLLRVATSFLVVISHGSALTCRSGTHAFPG